MLDRLAVSITTASGVVYRLGPDEPRAENQPTSLRFGTSVPGGYRDLALSLARSVVRDWPDLGLFNDVRVYGPGNVTVWEGRIQELPRSTGDEETVTIQAVGHSAHLRDDPSFQRVYVDVSTENWEDPSTEHVARRQAGGNPTNRKIAPNTKKGGISFEMTQNVAVESDEQGALMYRLPPGSKAARFRYIGTATANTNMNQKIRTTTDIDGAPAIDDTTLTVDSTLRSVTLSATDGLRYLWLTDEPTLAVNKDHHGATFSAVAVYDDHGLTEQSIDASTPHGFFGSDIIADVIQRAAPLLNATAIEATGFVIPHMSFREPVTAEDVVQAVNAYYLWEWGVYDDRVFFFRPPDPSRLTWEVALSDGVDLDLEGDSGEASYNGVIVTYTNANGEQRTAGPESSGCDRTDSDLQDLGNTNPVNIAEIPKRWGKLDISFPTTGDGAVRLGAAWLAEQSAPQRRGQMIVTGTARHPSGTRRPPWAIRAGDYVRVIDHSADVTRRVIETSFDVGQRTATLTLENPAHTIEAVLERVGLGLAGSRWAN